MKTEKRDMDVMHRIAANSDRCSRDQVATTNVTCEGRPLAVGVSAVEKSIMHERDEWEKRRARAKEDYPVSVFIWWLYENPKPGTPRRIPQCVGAASVWVLYWQSEDGSIDICMGDYDSYAAAKAAILPAEVELQTLCDYEACCEEAIFAGHWYIQDDSGDRC